MNQTISTFILLDVDWLATQLVLQFSGNQPFPLSLPYFARIIFALFLFLVLLIGLTLRRKIISYLRNQDVKGTPINTLLWIEQVLSLVSGLNILNGIFALLLPVPLKSIFGENFCRKLPLVPAFSLTASIVWSCLLALYRILFIKFDTWVKFGIGEKRLLRICVFLGVVAQVSCSFLLFYFDEENLTVKICSFYSSEDLRIIRDYKVSIFMYDLKSIVFSFSITETYVMIVTT